MAINLRYERPHGSGNGPGALWSAWRCPEGRCRREVWYIQADAWNHALWHVGEEPEQRDWKVAAEAPICPMCGVALVSMDA